jgi:hypothetical protein
VSAEEERGALLGLALASLPNEEEVRDALFVKKGQEPPPRLPESLAILTELTHQRAHAGVGAERARVSNRVLHLDLLAKVAARRPEALPPPGDGSLERLAEAAVAEADRIDLERDLPRSEVTGAAVDA